MGDYKINFYGGSNSGWNKSYTEFNETNEGRVISNGIYSSSIGLATDARTANQIKATTDKLNTGAMSAEVQLTMPDVAESIPNQHLDELNRLRKLTGTDLTLHGPLVEPTGVGRDRWDPMQREQAERQIWSAVQRAHRVKPDGNIVVTLHTSNGLPEPETKIWDEKNHKEIIQNIAVIDKRTGQFGALPKPKKDFLTNTSEDPYEELKRLNKENWSRELSQVNMEARRGMEILREEEDELRKNPELLESLGKLDKQQIYSYAKGKGGEDYIKSIKDPDEKKLAERLIENYTYGDIFIQNSYQAFKELYNKAYEVAERDGEKDSLNKLNKIKEEVVPIINNYDKDHSKVYELAKVVTAGLRELDAMEAPKVFEPLKKFAIDEASKTFANVAINAYNEFGKTAPVLSIENPPAGSGINRAEDMAALIDSARDKFAEKFKEKLGEEEARKQAEKLIGATWDVGHINMIRKYGYGKDELKEQTKKIAKYVKNIHLSDNFGMEHTELPMGMGNVPMQEHIAVLQEQFKEKLKDIKQVVETGNWYQHFQTTPFSETLAAFGSPIYGMKMAPYWNQANHQMGGYFAGYGMNPDIHHSIYGAGFSTLPVELGGQIQGRNRLSGSPME